MPRRRSTLAQRQRRFLKPLIGYSLPAFVTLIGTTYMLNKYCDFARGYAPNITCTALPSFVVWGLIAFVVGGVAASAHRFYLDHILGQVFDDY